MTSPWKGLLGALSNLIENLRGEGTPASAVRAVVHATLSYINAELFNALLLRRDCCSISSVKVCCGNVGGIVCDKGGDSDVIDCTWCVGNALVVMLCEVFLCVL